MVKRRKEINTEINARDIVLSALKKMMKTSSWTTRAIVKFIKQEYKISGNNLGAKISRALNRGVKMGLVQKERGRYRLNIASASGSVSSSELASRTSRDSRGPRLRGARPKRCDRGPRIRSRSYSFCCPRCSSGLYD